jgi:hypothetical protein
VWSDWTGTAAASLANGIRLDTNYYYWPGTWVNDRPGMFTGSGMPMRFADLTGRMIDVYQATTQMTDESGQTFPFTSNTLLDRALGAEGYYGVFTANMHTDSAVSAGATAIMNSAIARGVPVVSARQMLTWLDGRNASTYKELAWNGAVLTFRIEIGTGARGLRTMVPATVNGNPVTEITAGGVPVTFAVETIKGVSYATFEASSESYAVRYLTAAPDTTITSAPPAASTSSSATFQFTASVAGSTFQCSLDAGAYAACSSPVNLTGLASGSHTFRVRAIGAGGTDATPAVHNWTISLAAPDTTITSAPSSPSTSSTATFQFTASLAGSTFECSLDSGAYAACTTPRTLTGLASGSHTFRVRAINAGGTDATPATHTWTIALPVPDTTITSGPSGTTSSRTATFQFTSTVTGSTFACSLDGAAFTTCTSGVTYNSLVDGSHTFQVRATASGGTDASPAARTWTVDGTAPVISAVAVTPTTTSATITWTTNELSDSVVNYGTSSSSLTQTATVATMVTAHSVTLSGLSAGTTYFYRVSSRNAAALTATTSTASFATRTIVNQAPATATITSGSLRSGSASNLATNNGSYYQVNSTTSGTRTSTWYGSFTGVSRSLANLRVTYSGMQSRTVTQNVEIYQWSTSSWVTLNTRSGSTTEVLISNLAPSGSAVNYVSTGGEVRIRIRSVGSSTNFYTVADLLQISYDRP